MKGTATIADTTDLVLAFSPLFQTTEPHLAIAHLAAHMSARGVRVETRDLSVEFFQKIRDPASQQFIRTLLIEKDRRFQKTSPFDDYDYIKTHIALAALESLRTDGTGPPRLDEWNAFCRKVFAVQAAFGFDTVVQNDFHEFLDDLYTYNGVEGLPRDTRLGALRRSTIAETVTSERLVDWEANLFLRVYERFFLDSLLAPRPLAIGLSIATNEQIIQALSLGHLIKERAPGVHVVAGGSYIRYLRDSEISQLLDLGSFDSIAFGRGEAPLAALIDALPNGLEQEAIQGLILRAGFRGQNPALPASKEMAHVRSSLQVPADYGLLRGVLSDTSALGVLASEGCYWGKCRYCNYTGIRGAYDRPQLKPPDILVGELVQLRRDRDVRQFNLIGESISPAYACRISDLLLEQRADVELSIWARGESSFDADLCRKMYRSGFRYVTLGVESLCDRILQLLSKGTTVATNLAALRNMAAAGLKVQVNIILGLPTETPAEALETYTKLQQEMARTAVHSLVTFPFSVQCGSRIYQDPSQFGIELKPCSDAAFRPKNIFVPFSYVQGTTFKDVYTWAVRYQGPPAILRAPKVQPVYTLPPHVGHSCLSFIRRGNEIVREPSYVLVNFESGVAKVVSPSLGYAITATQRSGLPSIAPPGKELLELHSAGIIS